MKKEEIKKRIDGVENTIKVLKAKAQNAISDDARAEIEGHIAELTEAVNALKELESAAEQGSADNSEVLRTQMKEVLARLDRVEDITAKDTKVTANKAMSINAFAELVKNSVDREQFKKALKVVCTNGPDLESDQFAHFFPAAVVNEITSMFESGRHRLLELVDWTGLPVFMSLNENIGATAKVYPYGSAAAKEEQELGFDPVVIRPTVIYKYKTVPMEVFKETGGNNGALIRYIVRELADRVLTTVENYILKGYTDPTTGGGFIVPSHPLVSIQGDISSLPDFDLASLHVMNFGGRMNIYGRFVAVMHPAAYIKLRQQVITTWNYAVDDAFIGNNILGVDEIILMPYLGILSSNILITYLDPSEYKLVGDRRPDQFEDFNLAYNKKEYLTEMWIGGGSANGSFGQIVAGR